VAQRPYEEGEKEILMLVRRRTDSISYCPKKYNAVPLMPKKWHSYFRLSFLYAAARAARFFFRSAAVLFIPSLEGPPLLPTPKQHPRNLRTKTKRRPNVGAPLQPGPPLNGRAPGPCARYYDPSAIAPAPRGCKMGTRTETQPPSPVSKAIELDTGLNTQQAAPNAEPGLR